MADEHKGYANLHYPGIRPDPNDGRKVLDAPAHWRLGAQIACLGEGAQEILFETGAFVFGATPLGTAIARKLLTNGVGRVGVFGDEPLAGAHGLGPAEESTTTVLPVLAKWAMADSPWATLERFSGAAIDRSLDDMARGFEILVAANGAQGTGEALLCARASSAVVIAAHVRGKNAWCAAIPPGGACEKCLKVPELDSGSAGLYFPLLDFAASWVSAIVTETALGAIPAAAFVESIDATRTPWARETRLLERCEQCAPQK